MLLYEELLEICKNKEIVTPEDIIYIQMCIFKRCEEHYKKHLDPTMSTRQLKAYIDQTFNSYDCMVRHLEKSDDKKLLMLAEIFKKYDFKRAFLANNRMADLYEKLGKV